MQVEGDEGEEGKEEEGEEGDEGDESKDDEDDDEGEANWELLHLWWCPLSHGNVKQGCQLTAQRRCWRIQEGREHKNHCLELSKCSRQ